MLSPSCGLDNDAEARISDSIKLVFLGMHIRPKIGRGQRRTAVHGLSKTFSFSRTTALFVF